MSRTDAPILKPFSIALLTLVLAVSTACLVIAHLTVVSVGPCKIYGYSGGVVETSCGAFKSSATDIQIDRTYYLQVKGTDFFIFDKEVVHATTASLGYDLLQGE